MSAPRPHPQVETVLQFIRNRAFDSIAELAHSAAMTAVRIPIRVKPGASRTRVGGSLAERLVVAVCSQAVDGKATEAALKAVAEAIGVKRRDISLVSGATARDKVVQIEGDVSEIRTAIDRLMLA